MLSFVSWKWCHFFITSFKVCTSEVSDKTKVFCWIKATYFGVHCLSRYSVFHLCLEYFGSGTDHILPLILFLLLGDSVQKSLRLCCFKLDWDELWHDCSSRKKTYWYKSDFWWHHTFKWWASAAGVWCHWCSQFLISSTFVLVALISLTLVSLTFIAIVMSRLYYMVSQKPDPCDVFKWFHQIFPNSNDFWWRELSGFWDAVYEFIFCIFNVHY